MENEAVIELESGQNAYRKMIYTKSGAFKLDQAGISGRDPRGIIVKLQWTEIVSIKWRFKRRLAFLPLVMMGVIYLRGCPYRTVDDRTHGRPDQGTGKSDDVYKRRDERIGPEGYHHRQN